MNITAALNSVNTISSVILKDTSVSQDYIDVINKLHPVVPYQTRDEINSNDAALEQFKKDISTKGAAQFLSDLNEEKIKTLVEEYRQKLLKEKEANPENPMDINKMVSDYRKLLLKEMMEAQKAEHEKQKAEQNTNPLESQTLSTADIFDSIKESEVKSSNEKTVDLLELMINTVCIETDKKENEA
ncbi:MAG: hypothetical protein PHI47_09430 [Sulfuricurvum sp.]|uniref:hypothetical protein n=1 Tax=Sulfuricurvum sp. TaxID=2025608 RepID=UPI002601E0AA|nr:hypothetical protein [Sulfuricurvum sp.]MDD5158675.1 hypothetical protein [Sulfuricurvum sp.]MDD5160259.1 hypothetical protein [Sulfuricurvum sp.]